MSGTKESSLLKIMKNSLPSLQKYNLYKVFNLMFAISASSLAGAGCMCVKLWQNIPFGNLLQGVCQWSTECAEQGMSISLCALLTSLFLTHLLSFTLKSVEDTNRITTVIFQDSCPWMCLTELCYLEAIRVVCSSVLNRPTLRCVKSWRL